MATNGEFALVRRLADQLQVVVDVGANPRGMDPRGLSVGASGARGLLRDRLADSRAAHRDGGSPTGERDRNRPQRRRGAAPGEVLPADDRWSSMIDYPHPAPSIVLSEKVRRGDDVLAEMGIEHVDLLKVDTEGADLTVLQGFSAMLERGDVDVVQFEYGSACVIARALLLDFYELLDGCGYLVGRLGPHGVDFAPYRLESENFFGPNFVAARRGTD